MLAVLQHHPKPDYTKQDMLQKIINLIQTKFSLVSTRYNGTFKKPVQGSKIPFFGTVAVTEAKNKEEEDSPEQDERDAKYAKPN